MKKIIGSIVISIFTVPSILYYVTKYYIYGLLNFDKPMIIMFTVVSSLSIIGILLNIYNSYQNCKLQKQIIELNNLIEKYHYENLEYHENNREILLDLDLEGK